MPAFRLRPNAAERESADAEPATPDKERGAVSARGHSLTAAFALALLAAGCGGGEDRSAMLPPGSGPPAVVQPPPMLPRVPPPAATPADLRELAASYSHDPEFRTAWGLEQTGAATAYARIARRDGAGTAPGAGARVAVIDTGIDIGHWEFEPQRIGSTEPDVGLSDTAPGDPSPVDPQPPLTAGRHGTAVASVIAARRDGPVPSEHAQYDFHGIAWGIDHLQMTLVGLGSADPDQNYVAIDPAEVDYEVGWLAAQVSELTTGDFVNMSFGVPGLSENYLDQSFGASYATSIRALAQPDAADGRRILVIAAGNNNGHLCEAPEPNCVEGRIDASSPGLYAGLPALEESLRGHVVAVVATDREGRIAVFSNRCGIAAKWCIAAPGVMVPVAETRTDPDTGQITRGYAEASGTSLAAPHVTGGLAVLKHWFRSQLANEALLGRLYATARVTPDAVPAGGSCPEHLDLDGDLGACELSSEFGHGIMDLGAATAPVGQTSIARGGRVTEGGTPARSSGINSGRAMGDALGHALTGRRLALFDALGAPFWIDAAGFAVDAAAPDPAVRLSGWLAETDGTGAAPPPRGPPVLAILAGPAENALALDSDGLEGAHLGLVSQPAAAGMRLGNAVLSAFASTVPDGGAGAHALDADTHGVAVSWSPTGGRTGLRAGLVRETETLFGAVARGAFGRLSSGLFFVGARESFEAGDWRIGLSGEIGRSAPEAGGGLLADAGASAFSTAFSTEAARPLAGGTLRFLLVQPLRVESGRLELSLPTGRTPEGAVVRERVAVDLEPSGREIDAGMDWTGAVAPGAVLRIGARLIHEPGHVASRKPEAVAFAGLRIRM